MSSDLYIYEAPGFNRALMHAQTSRRFRAEATPEMRIWMAKTQERDFVPLILVPVAHRQTTPLDICPR